MPDSLKLYVKNFLPGGLKPPPPPSYGPANITTQTTYIAPISSIPPFLAALEGGSDKKTICQYGLKSIVYFDTCYLGIIFPKYLDSNFLQIFFMLLCLTGAKNSYKCVKYFIFHFFSHISWKIGLPLCLIVFML